MPDEKMGAWIVSATFRSTEGQAIHAIDIGYGNAEAIAVAVVIARMLQATKTEWPLDTVSVIQVTEPMLLNVLSIMRGESGKVVSLHAVETPPEVPFKDTHDIRFREEFKDRACVKCGLTEANIDCNMLRCGDSVLAEAPPQDRPA
jgi:hypothetical protein